MNNSQEVVKIIKETAKAKGIAVGKMLDACELSKNALSSMQSGYLPRTENLCKIADYLDVSVDFLLGRQKNNASEDDLRSVIIEKVRALTDEQAQKLLVLLETLFSEAE